MFAGLRKKKLLPELTPIKVNGIIHPSYLVNLRLLKLESGLSKACPLVIRLVLL